MADARITAEYLIETPLTIDAAAATIVGEQSTGTFTRVQGETDELRARFAARIESIEDLDSIPSASLPGAAKSAHADGCYRRGRVRVSFPLENTGPNLSSIISTVAGNLFELRQLSGVRLCDVEFPLQLDEHYPGPKFGVVGTRRLTDVYDRPIIGTIVKPSVGLTPTQTADLVTTLGKAGVDFVKDDELMANPPHSPLTDRVREVMRSIHRVADSTGRKVMYAFNITDRLDRMLEHCETVVAAGGTCVMLSLNSVGFAAADFLARRAAVPIHGHRNGFGMLYRHPALGMDFKAYQKLWRLAGIDQLHVNGLQNKFCEGDESVVRSIKACLTPTRSGELPMPVVSSGQWGGQAIETYRQTGTVDLMYLAGGGILGHPGGPTAGVTAIRQAWEAAVNGFELADYAASHDELRQSLQFYGRLECVSRR